MQFQPINLSTQVNARYIDETLQRILSEVPQGPYRPPIVVPEPDARRVQRIVGQRENPNTGETEYLCKFEGLSYIHVQWLSTHQLKERDASNLRILNDYQQYRDREDHGIPMNSTKVSALLARRFSCVASAVGTLQEPAKLHWRKQYLVQWQNLPPMDATWEDEQNLLESEHNSLRLREFLAAGGAETKTTPVPDIARQQILIALGFMVRAPPGSQAQMPARLGQQAANSAAKSRRSTGAKAISDPENVFKQAVVDTMEHAEIKQRQLQELVNAPPNSLYHWLYSRGRIDDHVEKALKNWLRRTAPQYWQDRWDEIDASVANLKERYSIDRLALRRFLGLSYVGLPMRNRSKSTKAVVDEHAERIREKSLNNTFEEKLRFVAPEFEQLSYPIALNAAEATQNLESYAMVPSTALKDLFEGLDDAFDGDVPPELLELHQQLFENEETKDDDEEAGTMSAEPAAAKLAETTADSSNEQEKSSNEKVESDSNNNDNAVKLNPFQEQLRVLSRCDPERLDMFVADAAIARKWKEAERVEEQLQLAQTYLHHLQQHKLRHGKIFAYSWDSENPSLRIPFDQTKQVDVDTEFKPTIPPRVVPPAIIPTAGPTPLFYRPDKQSETNACDSLPVLSKMANELFKDAAGMLAVSSTSIYLGGTWFLRGLSQSAFRQRLLASCVEVNEAAKTLSPSELDKHLSDLFTLYTQADANTRDYSIWLPNTCDALDFAAANERVNGPDPTDANPVTVTMREHTVKSLENYIRSATEQWNAILQHLPNLLAGQLRRDAQITIQKDSSGTRERIAMRALVNPSDASKRQ